MDFLTTVFIAIGLAMDAFAVSLGIGATGQCDSRRARFRLYFHFGLFQALMPVIGWFGGLSIEHLIRSFDHWIAFGLLLYVGGKMLVAGLKHDQETYLSDPSRGRMLVILAIATSIDALAVGLSLAMLRVSIVVPVIVIGVLTAALSWFGLHIGNRLGLRFGKRMEVLGGLILIGIGLRILISHLFGA